jgi:hypothetical protein
MAAAPPAALEHGDDLYVSGTLGDDARLALEVLRGTWIAADLLAAARPMGPTDACSLWGYTARHRHCRHRRATAAGRPPATSAKASRSAPPCTDIVNKLISTDKTMGGSLIDQKFSCSACWRAVTTTNWRYRPTTPARRRDRSRTQRRHPVTVLAASTSLRACGWSMRRARSANTTSFDHFA